ncbi:MAG: hypothetical protein A2104_00910 [Candidatus Melainabacteria bacterium GWF2_32_7]|nr:MAG: hypothetical protein A2104_00910 [Candidatus Melainabacteria bacterium GWF2_32_7]
MHFDVYISSKIKDDLKEVVNIANRQGLNIELKGFVKNRDLDNLDALLPVYKDALKDFNGKLALHGAYQKVNPVSKNPEKREFTIYRYSQSVEIAKILNVKTIVFHTGYDSFRRWPEIGWFIDEHVEFWKSFMKKLDGTDIIIVLENTDERKPEILIKIVDRVKSEKLKLCIDTGHVNHKTHMTVKEWIEKEGNRLYHMHLHNNYKVLDDHNSLLKGTIDFKEVFETLKENNLTPNLSLEITDYEATMESLEFMRGQL